MPDIYTLAYAIWDNDAKQASMSPVIDAYYDWPAVPVDHRIAVTSRITMRVLREVIAWLPGGDFERLSSVASLQQAVKILENLVMVSIDIPLSVDVGSEQETLDVGRFVLEARQNALYAAQSALRDACVPLYAAHAAAYAASAAYCVAHNRAKAALECLPSLSQHSAGAERAAEKFASAEASEIMKKAAKIWVEERYYSTTYCAQVVR
jgi:hypothetical protein